MRPLGSEGSPSTRALIL
ncbi:hypothetical protein E2C01_088720 [Portunus trituberculatus]|uniref:Uncharacterized protein n=1 Tax=Portunus trituberculatus TaxID=210409 RepID=A0A5B7JH88_PORTR|nr:hypothetical protein [Portunus trituberculatus]